MKYTIINTENTLLNQNTFKEGSTVYVIRGNYSIESQITIPPCCELRIEEGSITLIAAKDTGRDLHAHDYRPNGFYLLCSDQNKKKEDDENQENKDVLTYKTLCLTSKAIRVKEESSEGDDNKTEIVPTKEKDSLKYQQTTSVFMKTGDYIRNMEPDNFEMKLTANCRILLPENTKSANLFIYSDKVNAIQIDGKCNFQLFAENCKFERIFACYYGMVLTHRIEVIDDDSDNKETTEAYLNGGDGYSIFKNCEIYAEDFDTNLIPPDSCFLSIWAMVGTKKKYTGC